MSLDSGVNRLETSRGTYQYFSPERLDLPVLQFESDQTGLKVTTIVNDAGEGEGVRKESREAWSMARQSRSADQPLEILEEIHEANRDPDKSLNKVFEDYGHASVADMAEIGVQFESVPFHIPLGIFNFGVQNSGQEKSTRYQPQFKETSLDSLDHYFDSVPGRVRQGYEELRGHAQSLFQKHYDMVGDAFTDHFKPSSDRQASSLESRVFDSVRGSLLLGQRTGFGFKTKARRWSDLIGLLKGSHNNRLNDVGETVEALLAPEEDVERQLGFKSEAPSLLRYTDAESRHREGFEYIKDEFLDDHEFYESVDIADEAQCQVMNTGEVFNELTTEEKIAYQAIQRAHPGAEHDDTVRFVQGLSDKAYAELGDALFGSHTHHVSPSPDTAASDTSFRFTTSLGELRDWNRHRAWSRFLGGLPIDVYSPEPSVATFREITSQGHILPRYLTSDEETFAEERKTMNADYTRFMEELHSFYDVVDQEVPDEADKSFLLNTLPFATRTNLVMHANPKQSHYLTFLRHRPGGHINYRVESYEANQSFADTHALYEATRLDDDKRPSPLSRKEFFDRS
jgi:hypothetical protein